MVLAAFAMLDHSDIGDIFRFGGIGFMGGLFAQNGSNNITEATDVTPQRAAFLPNFLRIVHVGINSESNEKGVPAFSLIFLGMIGNSPSPFRLSAICCCVFHVNKEIRFLLRVMRSEGPKA